MHRNVHKGMRLPSAASSSARVFGLGAGLAKRDQNMDEHILRCRPSHHVLYVAPLPCVNFAFLFLSPVLRPPLPACARCHRMLHSYLATCHVYAATRPWSDGRSCFLEGTHIGACVHPWVYVCTTVMETNTKKGSQFARKPASKMHCRPVLPAVFPQARSLPSLLLAETTIQRIRDFMQAHGCKCLCLAYVGCHPLSLGRGHPT